MANEKRLFRTVLPVHAAWLLVIAVALDVRANDYYVDVNWGGPFNGTQAEPYKTIKAAVDAANAVAANHNIFIADGWYGDVANGGTEDYSAGGGTGGGGGGISIQRKINFYGGYAGWQSGSTFDWTTRNPRTTQIDLRNAGSRAFTADTPTHAALGPIFDGMSFSNASHSTDGGAIHQSSSYYEGMGINNCLFQSNSVTGSGGAVFNSMDCPGYSILNSDFINNTATGDGGALWEGMNNGTLYITNCIFRGNRATGVGSQGGAGLLSPAGPIYIQNSFFENNQSGGRGGAVFSPSSVLYLRTCNFRSNSAPEGAAIGGSTYHVGSYDLQNCLIYGNSGGYAVRMEGQNAVTYSIDMLHCTVVSNSGGGIYASTYQTKPLRVRNSIITDNGQYGIRLDADDQDILQNNNVYSNAAGNYFNCAADAASISTDPQFLDAPARNYRLAITSPSIDAGTNDTGLVTDYVGTMRPTRNGWDQGAYEEIDACRIQNLAPATTRSNVVLRGQLDYDGARSADVHIYWGVSDGGTNRSAWANTNVIGLRASPATFAVTNDVTTGQSYWFRCFVSNAYDKFWADASWPFTAEDVHLWTGAAGGNLASTAGNWYNSFLPTANGTVKLDSYDVNMTWDAAAPHQVMKWIQTDQYDGTVTIGTGWSNGFDSLSISNDMVLQGGTMTHLDNTTGGAALYRLKIDVGGNFTLAVGKQINLDGKGYENGTGPGGAPSGPNNFIGATHGGEGHLNTSACYGSVWEPVTLGSGGGSPWGRDGGGAAYITVAGTSTVDGVISAAGEASSGNNGYGGAGGSVFLRTGHLAGSGTLKANGSGSGHDASGGGGGRVAVILTNDTSFAGVTLQAYGFATYGDRNSAAGTVYRESMAHTHNQGIVILDNNSIQTRRPRTVIPASHPLESFAAIVLTNCAVLGFDAGDTFDFGSMGNIRPEGPDKAYITVRSLAGITFPSPFTISGYTLRLDTPVTETASWTVATNGVLSHSPYDPTGSAILDLTLDGNLTVDGNIDVRPGGYVRSDDTSGNHGPGYSGAGGSYGGLGYGAGAGYCYGSILNPSHYGSAAFYGSGGGRARLVVSSNTVLNGSILAGCYPINSQNASGGSLDLQTRTLSGTGTISATGGRVSNPGPTFSEQGGGGGRIRVKLTGSDSFDSVIFAASGGRGGPGNTNGTGGAGTIYLEGASESGGRGRIIIGNANNTPVRGTEFPPTQLFSDDLRSATLMITNGAWVGLTTNALIGDLYVSTNSTFNLNGYKVHVSHSRHRLQGTVILPGQITWMEGSVFTLR